MTPKETRGCQTMLTMKVSFDNECFVLIRDSPGEPLVVTVVDDAFSTGLQKRHREHWRSKAPSKGRIERELRVLVDDMMKRIPGTTFADADVCTSAPDDAGYEK